MSIQVTTQNEVILKWRIPSDYEGNPSELKAIIRHSSFVDGTAVWPDSTFLREVTATTDYVILPLVNGTYMVKFQDLEGQKSPSPLSHIVNIPDEQPKLLVQTRREDQDSPVFQGQQNDIFYSSDFDALVLNNDDLVDDKSDFEQGYLGSLDFGGELLSSGKYFFKDKLDLGGIFTVEFKRILKTRGLYPNNTIDLHFTNIDTWSDFDGLVPDETNAQIFFRKSNDAPTDDEIEDENAEFILLEDGNKFSQEDTQTYDDFIPMENGRFTGRVFQFKVELSSNFADQTPLVDELGYEILFQNRTESVATTSGGSNPKVITFDKAFYQTPNLGITASNMATGDYYVISSQSRTGFSITFFNSSNSAIDRAFAYHANGFGAEGA